MAIQGHAVSLGFTQQQFPPGLHICHIYSADEERQETLLHVIGSGLGAGGWGKNGMLL